MGTLKVWAYEIEWYLSETGPVKDNKYSNIHARIYLIQILLCSTHTDIMK